MAPVFSALIGAVAALVGVWVTQWLTNQREFQRDQLRWAQERQQRELDKASAILTTAMSAVGRWYMALRSFNTYLNFQELPRPAMSDLDELARQAREALAPVQLHCSPEAAKVTLETLEILMAVEFALQEAHQDAINEGKHEDAGVKEDDFDEVIEQMRDVYRAELASLAAEPVVLPRESHRWLRVPWRKSS